MFIFDEIDKMPEGMIDGIKPFIDHHENVGGKNFRKSIFIFLSNTGGRAITKETHRFWLEGKQREDISYTDLESLVNVGAFNELGAELQRRFFEDFWGGPLILDPLFIVL